jgi:hypothetical protein
MSGKTGLTPVSSKEQAQDAILEFYDEFGEYPDTYSDWNGKRHELGYSTRAANFSQNTGEAFGTVKAEVKGEEVHECDDCGKSFDEIAKHWSQSRCSYPTLTDREVDILKGIAISDGWIAHSDHDRSILHIESVTKPFLEWFKGQVSIVHTDVKLRRTAEESYDNAVESSILDNQNIDNYRNIYRVNTLAHPHVHGMSGLSVGDIEQSRMQFKMFYVCDGGVHWNDDFSFIQFTASKSLDEIKHVVSVLDELGFSSSWNRLEGAGKVVYIHKESVDRFLDWIGEPIPGFEYKWETDDRERYEEKKGESSW